MSSDDKPVHRTTERDSTPRNEMERKQKARTDSEMADMWSELHKLARQRRTLGDPEYKKKRDEIISKYAFTRQERMDYLDDQF